MRLARSLSILSVCLVAMSGLAGHLNTAAAQQPEKRIALVVGNAAYAKSPLATAANDAGLIAQTLQAAGFDVIGARDLDGDTLRKSFRDFIQKAESSGPDTVAMVYLAGYGLQLAGENYFVPVDSAINRDTDVPIEALRTGDYIRQLASLPLKAGIVVLDAARQQPFVNGQIASGLALVEADPHMLIAFNAAPGTVAPAEQGPYGVYAQSLAEMIRTGGLPLPEVFNRVRLRVNEASKGAQVPWDSQKVDAAFTFFERAPDAPAAASPDQVAAIRSKPIRDLGVQDAYAAVLERDTLPAYEDFLAAYPDDPHGEAGEGDRGGAARGDHLAPHLPRRHPERLLVVSATLSARASCRRRAPPPCHSHRVAGAAAGIRCHRLRRAAAAAGRVHLCRSTGAGLRRSRVRFCPAATGAGLLPAAAAGRFRGAGAAAATDRAVHPAAADLRADTGLCAGRRAMWRRRRTTSSLPTSTTGPSSTT